MDNFTLDVLVHMNGQGATAAWDEDANEWRSTFEIATDPDLAKRLHSKLDKFDLLVS